MSMMSLSGLDLHASTAAEEIGSLCGVKKVKFTHTPYSIPSVGPGADPGVQAVSPQVT